MYRPQWQQWCRFFCAVGCSQRNDKGFPHPSIMLAMNVSVVSLRGACVARKHSLKSHGEGGMWQREGQHEKTWENSGYVECVRCEASVCLFVCLAVPSRLAHRMFSTSPPCLPVSLLVIGYVCVTCHANTIYLAYFSNSKFNWVMSVCHAFKLLAVFF